MSLGRGWQEIFVGSDVRSAVSNGCYEEESGMSLRGLCMVEKFKRMYFIADGRWVVTEERCCHY